jgi:hypothetical protein
MRVFIGYDQNEHKAAYVARRSLLRVTKGEITPELLCIDRLVAQGLIWRTFDRRGGQSYDLVSQAPQSTDFAISRFLTPIIGSGWCLFVDCDVVFLRDPRQMFPPPPHPDSGLGGLPVYVVKHNHEPHSPWKMVNQIQLPYARKNWSSVMLFNCEHDANHRLSLRDVNERPGRDLHRFYWLHDNEIGALDPEWNWLVDVEPRPEKLGIAHMTLGGPWLEGWKGGSFDEEWHEAAK